MTRNVEGMFAFVTMTLAAGVACAQDYPNKPVRIVTSVAGSATDFAARLIAQKMSVTLGQALIVDNRTGYLSAEIVSKAQPDGYTLLVAGTPTFHGPLLQKMSYDPVKDLAPISLLVGAPQILVVSPTLPVNSVPDLIALAKSKPGVINYASGSTGGSGHLAGELFKAMAGVAIVRIAYKGTALAFPDLINGQVHMMFENPTVMMQHIKAGKVKGLAVTSLKPTALVPGLPTVAASLPGFEILSVATILAPAKTPPAIIKRLNEESVRTLNQADVVERFFNTGADVIASSPEQLAAWIKGAMASMGKVIKDAGIRIE